MFYRKHQPVDIYEKHFLAGELPCNTNKTTAIQLKTQGGINVSYTNSEFPPGPMHSLPWEYPVAEWDYKGEKELGPEHGNQHHGPVSMQKLELEVSRLEAVKASISRYGFKLRDGDNIRGYFLINDQVVPWAYVFLVVGGQHRVSAMVNSGYQSIIAEFQPYYPRAVFRSHSRIWPGIMKGRFLNKHAKMIFDFYFRDPNECLW